MSGPDPNRLVKITSIVESSDGQTTYLHGTGYFVTGDLILTAKHVLSGGNLLKISYFVHARAKEWRDAELQLAWDGKELDAVLLKVNDPLDELPLQDFLDVLPEKNVVWESAGYPSAATQESDEGDAWTSVGLEGKLYVKGGVGQRETELDLGVGDPPEGKGWRGISGAPVFVDDKLAGIIKSTLTAFGGSRLAGIPISHLLRAPGFSNTINPPWLEPFSTKPWCLVLVSETQEDKREDLKLRIRSAIRRKVRQQGQSDVEEEPKVVVVTEALESRERWLQFVKVICAAPVMVIDVTKFEPAVMLMLGIRAVVRRGVTITTTSDKLNIDQLAALPFNIQETKLISFAGSPSPSPQHPVDKVGQAILDGLAQLKSYPRYLDLPAYDAVRCPEPKAKAKDNPAGQSDDAEAKPGNDVQTVQDTVLMLCPFQPNYNRNWLQIYDGIISVAEKDLVRMLDIMSPRLVGQALYEHIRWSRCCIVDWTQWRANVFFELGVRLACSNIGPICIIEESENDAPVPPKQKEQLIRLLDPIRYKDEDSLTPFKQVWKRYQSYISRQETSPPPSTLEHNETYRTIAFEAYDWEQELITMAPHEELLASVETQLGKDPQSAGKYPALFSSHPEFMKELQRNAAERWIAAWYYFIKRYSKEISSDDAYKQQAIKLGEAAVEWIPNQKEYEEIMGEINDVIDELLSQ